MNENEQNPRPAMQENPITCANLFKALAAAQGTLTNPTKDTEGYNYKYATLDQVIDILREVLPQHGLCYMQNPIPAGDGQVSIQTIVGHESGEHISSVLTMPVVENGRNNSAQNYGGTLTYIRRYALTSVFGLATETDEDAKGKDKAKQVATPVTKPAPKKVVKLPSQQAEEDKLREQVKLRLKETGAEEMAAGNGLNVDTAAVQTLRAILAYSDAKMAEKVKAFEKSQEQKEAA